MRVVWTGLEAQREACAAPQDCDIFGELYPLSLLKIEVRTSWLRQLRNIRRSTDVENDMQDDRR